MQATSEKARIVADNISPEIDTPEVCWRVDIRLRISSPGLVLNYLSGGEDVTVIYCLQLIRDSVLYTLDKV